MIFVAYATSMRILPTAVMFLASLMAAGQSVSAAELRCLATTGMIGDLVKAVVIDRGQVEVLMSSEVDPHLSAHAVRSGQGACSRRDFLQRTSS